MTRTQKLGLCTWLPEDPVCLAEVNDNFSRLDTSGARALRQAEAGLIALGGVMAAQAHQGGHAAYSDSIQADAFSDMEQVADYIAMAARPSALNVSLGSIFSAGFAVVSVRSSSIRFMSRSKIGSSSSCGSRVAVPST